MNSPKLFLSAFFCAALLASCGTRGGNTTQTADSTAADTARSEMTGGDRDAHGCIGSAGYQWSSVQQRCIRIFEAGVQLISATDPNATLAAYLVFSTDSLQAELFMPQSDPYVLQRRSLPGGGYAWNIEDDDTPNVRKMDGKWTVERRAKLIYKQSDK